MAMYTEQRSQLEIFSQNLRDVMYQKNVSQNTLAKKLDCSVSTVNSWCQGASLPRRDRFDKLCQFLNVSRLDLLADSIPQNLLVPPAHPLRMLGRICAGDGMLCDENFEGYFFVDNSIRADYCLRVEGDSMKDQNINHGDVAFLKRNYDLLDGNIYAVVYGDDNTASLKQVYRQEPDSLVLLPANPKYSPIIVKADEALIVGECVGVYHPR